MHKKKKTVVSEKTEVETETIKVPKTKPYYFKDNVFLGGQVYQKDSCINLTEDELKTFQEYVYEKKVPFVWKKPCRRCS